MKYSIITGLLLAVFSLSGQHFVAEDYDWQETEYHDVTVDDSTNVYEILNKRLFNYYYNDDNQLELQFLYHRAVHINNTEALESFNKIYISQSENNILKFKARVLNSEGEVKEISEDKILTGVDKETEQEYVFFALEGLKVGSQVEYFYIKTIGMSTKGTEQSIQSSNPIQRYELDIITPWNLVMGTKVYNLDAEFQSDTTVENQNRVYLALDSIEPLEEESNSFYDANLGKAMFKLDHNLYTGAKNIGAYSHIGQNVVTNINRELSKKEKKAIQKIKAAIEESTSDPNISFARKAENYIKTNYQYVDLNNAEFSDITFIKENKAYSEVGGLILITNLLKANGDVCSYLYTTDRSELPFDPDFSSNLYLETLLLKIEGEEGFMDITDGFSRMGYTSEYFTHNYALVIEEMAMNDNIVAISATEFIPAMPATFTMDSLLVQVSFGESLTENNLDVKRVLSGYTAGFYQPILDFIKDPDSKKEFEEDILTYINSEADVAEMTIENGNANALGIKPLVVNGTLEVKDIVEMAGNNYLFKVGALIGPQSEMYDEDKERKLPIQTSHARSYYRTIQFEIPEGYTLGGLESLAINEELIYNEEVSGLFKSTYTVEGSTVTVVVYEYYNEVEYPKELFEDYKRVINAAADFNKKTLLLKKAS